MKWMVFDVGGTEIKYSVMDEELNVILRDYLPHINKKEFVELIKWF